MGNWKRLFTLMPIVMIAFVLLSPLVLVSAQPPDGANHPAYLGNAARFKEDLLTTYRLCSEESQNV